MLSQNTLPKTVNSTWLQTLLGMAQESNPTHNRLAPWVEHCAHPRMDEAYSQCERITAAHSRSFHMASALLPTGKRRPMRALYAFCRLTDDIADSGLANPQARLAQMRQRMLTDSPSPEDPVALAWADTRARFHIPLRYAEQLIEGVERDLRQNRYASFDELAVYCYGVASTVGLMSMHIVGFDGPEAVPYAVTLGVALQLTNILRDVGEDWRGGRFYLPLDELAAFGLTEADVETGQVDDRWRSFLRFQIARTRSLYAEGWDGIARLHADGRFAVAAAARLYEAILDDIEAHDYNVFNRRAHVPDNQKLLMLFKIYWQTRQLKRTIK